MKVSREYLKRIIKEELEKAIDEETMLEFDPAYGAMDIEDTAEYKKALQMAMEDPADKKSLFDQLKQWMQSVGLAAVPGQEAVTGMDEQAGSQPNILKAALAAAEKDEKKKKSLLALLKKFISSDPTGAAQLPGQMHQIAEKRKK